MLALIREDPLVDEDQERMNKRLEKLEVRGKGTLGDKSHLRKSVVIERHSNSAYGESRPALSNCCFVLGSVSFRWCRSRGCER